VVAVGDEERLSGANLPEVGAQPGFELLDIDRLHGIKVVTSDHFVKMAGGTAVCIAQNS
jgi:hypothetical protein